MRISSFICAAATLVELGIVSWCAFHPLAPILPQLTTFQAWLRVYNISLSNIDIWLTSAIRCTLFTSLVLSAPGKAATKFGPRHPANHKQLKVAVGLLASVFEAWIMAKAAVVAVIAPEQIWPSPVTDSDTPHFVGLIYMYVSVVVAMLGSLIQAGAAASLISAAQTAYEATPEADGLEAPLLGKEQEAGKGAYTAVGSRRTSYAGSVTKEQAGKAPKAVSSKTVWALLRLSAPDWPVVVAAFLFGSLAALAQATVPYYTGQVIDYASIEPDREKFWRTILALVLVSAACGIVTGMRGGLFTVAMSRLNVRIRRQLFHALLQMEIGFFDVTKTGEITSRLAADTTTVSDQVCLNLNVMLRSMTQATMVLGFMFVASWRLTVVTFILVPVVMTISKIYGRYFANLAKRVQTMLAEANSVAEEVLSSMTTVKAHAAQDSAEAAYATKLDQYFSLLLKEAVAYAAYMAANTFLPNSVSALVLFYGGHLVLNNQMSPGALVSFMLYQQSLSAAFQNLGDVFSALTAAVGAADKVFELMGRKPEVDAGGTFVPSDFQGHVALRDVHFTYPARPQHLVLRGLTFDVAPGQVVALVGPSGGGKSSIVKLVERFYTPQQGAVLLDGRDVGIYHPKWLRRQVALVSQEPVLYARSIRRNICYGLEAEDGISTTPTQEEIEEAARQANAHAFICSFPDGYDTDCGEKGVQLSGGQKQRLAIARALVRKPRVLLLDEATSALDADSEAVVQEALDRVMAGRTVLVIAHRLSTIQNADRIIVIGDGTVQETGTHDELLAGGGIYATLVRRQITKTASMVSLSQLTGPSSSPRHDPSHS